MTLRGPVDIYHRKMPERVNLGNHFQGSMAMPMLRRKDAVPSPHGLRSVMGFYLPTWQRPLVWTEAQKISFMESAWRGLNLGTYTYNQADIGSPLDNLLIDGQQRMAAIESYLDDAFPVFGWRWSEVTVIDRRMFGMSIIFAGYVVETEDESYLKAYYNMTNFGGTPHTEGQRA